MKRIFLFLTIFTFSIFIGKGQSCENNFIAKLKAIWPQKIEKIDKKVRKLSEKNFEVNCDSIKVIYIPQLLCYKKIKSETKINKENFFCVLNPKSLLFYSAKLKSGKTYFSINSFFGKISQIIEANETEKRLFDSLSYLIKKYNSSYFFTIYNSWNYLFLIKEDRILAFKYYEPEKELDLNKVIEEIMNDPFTMRYNKPEETICY